MKKPKIDIKEYLKLLFTSPTVGDRGPVTLYMYMQLIYGTNDKHLEEVYKILKDEAQQVGEINGRFNKVTTEIMGRFEVEAAKTKTALKKLKVSRKNVHAAGKETAETAAMLASLNKK